jgi:transcriptional regulator with XRE-family HTH domain
MYQDKVIEFKGRGGNKRINIYRKEAQALKDIRIAKNIKRQHTAQGIGCDIKTIARFENGKTIFSEERMAKLLRHYRISREEFHQIIEGKKIINTHPPRPLSPKRRPRKYLKKITKATRVLKSMRKMCGLNKAQAGKLCGMHPNSIDHRENGRVDLTDKDVQHIVLSYGRTMEEFHEMMNSDILRDEVIEECIKILQTIAPDKLRAVRALLINFK